MDTKIGWREELEEKYNHLFEKYEGQETETSYYKNGQILRGIECGIGWEKPVEDFLKSLDWHTTHNTYIENPDYNKDLPRSKDNEMYIKGDKNKIEIFQIKEKFGEVRAYVSYPEHIRDGINVALGRLEALCSVTCENCGKLENDIIHSNGGWISCLCSECRGV